MHRDILKGSDKKISSIKQFKTTSKPKIDDQIGMNVGGLNENKRPRLSL
jgi:hypothetical protein